MRKDSTPVMRLNINTPRRDITDNSANGGYRSIFNGLVTGVIHANYEKV